MLACCQVLTRPVAAAAQRDWTWDRPTHAAWCSGRLSPPLGKWQAVQCLLQGYRPGLRRAVVILRGKDEIAAHQLIIGPHQAGHLGAKFAGPQLSFGQA